MYLKYRHVRRRK